MQPELIGDIERVPNRALNIKPFSEVLRLGLGIYNQPFAIYLDHRNPNQLVIPHWHDPRDIEEIIIAR